MTSMSRNRPEYMRKWAAANQDRLREYQRRRRAKLAPKIKERTDAWRAENKQRLAAKAHERYLRYKADGRVAAQAARRKEAGYTKKYAPRRHVVKLSKYGLTGEQYDSLAASQSGRCAICRRPATEKRLSVDHDHDTGSVRGLLCHRCNMGLGYFLDDPALVADAFAYLVVSKKERTNVA